MSLLVVLTICAVVLVILSAPFRRTAAAPSASDPAGPVLDDASAAPEALRELADEKDRVFQGLADLRFDYESGKLSRHDFDAEDARLRARAAELLRALDDG